MGGAAVEERPSEVAETVKSEQAPESNDTETTNNDAGDAAAE